MGERALVNMGLSLLGEEALLLGEGRLFIVCDALVGESVAIAVTVTVVCPVISVLTRAIRTFVSFIINDVLAIFTSTPSGHA